MIAGMAFFAAFSQSGHGSFVASLSGDDRISVVKTSIDVPSWHEKSFWPVYEVYRNEMEQVSMESYRSLFDLASLDIHTNDAEAIEHVRKLFQFRKNELSLLNRYYSEMSRDFNGIIALQFLQTEVLLDMMENAGIYNKTIWKNFRFHPNTVSGPRFEDAKHNILRKALVLNEEQEKPFFEIYNRYEDECYAYLGDNYDLVSMYAGNPSDFTPAIAKRLGYNLLTVMDREQKLKEKYFDQINQALGAAVAARFVAWEDYYSLVSKMHSWAGEQ